MRRACGSIIGSLDCAERQIAQPGAAPSSLRRHGPWRSWLAVAIASITSQQQPRRRRAYPGGDRSSVFVKPATSAARCPLVSFALE